MKTITNNIQSLPTANQFIIRIRTMAATDMISNLVFNWKLYTLIVLVNALV